MSREDQIEKNILLTSELCVQVYSTALQYVSVVLFNNAVSLKRRLIVVW